MKMMGDRLTSQDYWDSTYEFRSDIQPISVEGYKNLCAKFILEKKENILKNAKSVLEIGGAGSPWVTLLANRYPQKKFFTLDFSARGNRALSEYVSHKNIRNLKIFEGDFFSSAITNKNFDLVYSHGVVEHFVDLPEVLRAHSQFLSQDGRMLTIIPNMTGILGILTRALNREIYNIHVPHDLISFRQGHACAGLKLIESGYLCSNNFGVLSSCVTQESAVKFSFYKLLTRISKASWLFEDKICRLPQTKFFSPYIYAISEKG